mmetsp:Transcript_17072/g.24818  ORF Transcript_17072/g.24818 Transcript_17072/m.24818 type:complete len:230 (-) Transcript_17072:4498-5187(-)
MRRPGLGHGAGQLRHPRLCRPVGNAAGKGACRLQRGKVHDPPPALLPHARHQRLAQEKRRAEVQGKGLIPGLWRDLIRHLARIDPGSMYQDIRRPKGGGDSVAQIRDSAAIGHVRRDPVRRRTDLCLQALQCRDTPGNAHDLCASRGQGKRCLPTQTRAGAGDAGHPPRQIKQGAGISHFRSNQKSHPGNIWQAAHRQRGHALPCLRVARCAPWPRQPLWSLPGLRAAR